MGVQRETHAERMENQGTVKEAVVGIVQRGTHPPEIPDEGQVVTSAGAWHDVAQPRQHRPEPHEKKERKQRHRRAMPSEHRGHIEVMVLRAPEDQARAGGEPRLASCAASLVSPPLFSWFI